MSEQSRIPTNLRTLKLLEVLGRLGRAATASEINSALGLPKQTVHRLCTTLEKEGYLARQGDSRRFIPGTRAKELSLGLLHAPEFNIMRHQILKDLAAQVRETVNYVSPEPQGMSYVDRVETDWMFRIQLPVGSHVPFHCTASGKCFMASLEPKVRARFVAALSLERLTDRTHVDPTALLEELEQISSQGYSLDDEEFMEGMVAIAVPVLDRTGQFVAALAFHGPTARLSIPNIIQDLDLMQSTSQRLTDTLFD